MALKHSLMLVPVSIKTTTRNSKHRRTAAKPAACADSISGSNLACDCVPVVYAYRFDFIWIDVLCHPCWAKKNIQPHFHILLGSCANPFLPIHAKFCRKQQTHCLRFHAKFRLNLFIVSPSRDEKLHFFGKC